MQQDRELRHGCHLPSEGSQDPAIDSLATKLRSGQLSRREFLRLVALLAPIPTVLAKLLRALDAQAAGPGEPEVGKEDPVFKQVHVQAQTHYRSPEVKARIQKDEVTPPREVGEWRGYQVFVYPDGSFGVEASVRSLAATSTGELIVGWGRNRDNLPTLTVARRSSTVFTDYYSLRVPAELGITGSVDQIAPTKNNGIYFGGLDEDTGYLWYSPEGRLVPIPDFSHPRGRLTNMWWFESYNDAVVAARPRELYYIEGSEVAKWGLKPPNRILALTTSEANDHSDCYALLELKRHIYQPGERRLYRLTFISQPGASLRVENIGVVDMPLDHPFIRMEYDRSRNLVFGMGADTISFFFTHGQQVYAFKSPHGNNLTDLTLTPGGELWGGETSGGGIFSVLQPFTSGRAIEIAPEVMLANPYPSSLVGREGYIVAGHTRFPNQFNDATLTQFQKNS
jgi:hypothetical protein